MSKAEWGTKRVCPSCGKLYYDMKKTPPVCPACKTPFDPETLLRTRRGRASEKKPAAKPVDTIDDLPIAEDSGEDADSMIEDAEELGDDEVDDVVEVEASEQDD
ncbi:MAG: TIGR02300 family protein [Alphaproteobacteria bacterium]|nr:TIGR02300 family protein [Alphaproteobacteria bacterium]